MSEKRDIIIKRILDMYSFGTSAPDGIKLPPERELAAQLGVSRILLREALVALDVMGFLETQGRNGTYIKKPMANINVNTSMMNFLPVWPEKVMPQFCEMRMVIEVNASKFAAIRINDRQLSEIKTCYNKLELEINNGNDVIKQSHYELMLHYLVVNASENVLLQKIYTALSEAMAKQHELIHQSLIRDSNWGVEILKDQEQIINALEQHNVLYTGNAMKNHLVKTFKRYTNQLDKRALDMI